MSPLLAHGTGLELLLIPVVLLFFLFVTAFSMGVIYVFVDLLVALILLLVWKRRRHLFWGLPLVNVLFLPLTLTLHAHFYAGMPVLKDTDFEMGWQIVVGVAGVLWALVCGLVMAGLHAPIRMTPAPKDRPSS